MIIYHWAGQGHGLMEHVFEYIILAQDEDEFREEHDTEQEAIEANTSPGFTFYKKYDTDIDTDFVELPLNTMLRKAI